MAGDTGKDLFHDRLSAPVKEAGLSDRRPLKLEPQYREFAAVGLLHFTMGFVAEGVAVRLVVIIAVPLLEDLLRIGGYGLVDIRYASDDVNGRLPFPLPFVIELLITSSVIRRRLAGLP
jgi:hypothetical protein